MRISLISGILLSAGVTCASCAIHKPATANWRLIELNTGDVLIPPGVGNPGLSKRTFSMDLAAGRGACPPSIRVQRKRVSVTVTRDMLTSQPPGWLTAWAAELESHDCIAPGEGARLAARIAESLPLDPGVAFHLLYPNDRQTGQVDIAPPIRLQIVSPILGDDAGHTLNGYETAWYSVQSRPAGNGFTIAPLFAERHIKQVTERRPQPSTNYLLFPSEAAFYRLFYKSGQTAFTALVIAAPTRAELDRLTRRLDNSAASCETLTGKECVAIPRRVAINAFIPITVNGSEVMVNWGANVADAIRNTGELRPQTVLPKLSVLKLYNGRATAVDFDRTKPAVLRLFLTGGETISWSQLRDNDKK